MTRDEALALALRTYQDVHPRETIDAPKCDPAEWVLAAIRRAAQKGADDYRASIPTSAAPGPGAPFSPGQPADFRNAAFGLLRVEMKRDGFDLLSHFSSTTRAHHRESFAWDMADHTTAAKLRVLADHLAPATTAKPEQVAGESKIDRAFAAAEWQFIASSLGLARAALKQAGYPDQQFEGAQVLASTRVDEFRRTGGAS